jgi:hypothetical protein
VGIHASTSWTIKRNEINGRGRSHKHKLVVALHIARDAKSIGTEGMYRINALLVDRGSMELG